MALQVEWTDTCGGEANYCWVKRAHIPASNENLSDRAIVRRIKAWAGLTGYRCNTSRYSDTIEIRPCGMCQVIFAYYTEDDCAQGEAI